MTDLPLIITSNLSELEERNRLDSVGSRVGKPLSFSRLVRTFICISDCSYRKGNLKMVRQKKHSELTLSEYQAEAERTDHTGDDPQDGILVSVLGIVGEAGDLATLFKKKLRDGNSYTVYPEQCAEELGDILWYVANLSRKLGFSLDDIARTNLAKTNSRWGNFSVSPPSAKFLDDQYPVEEQIPRRFVIAFNECNVDGRLRVVLSRDGVKCGDSLSDNSHFEDGYRYHDIFHLAYAAVLGWSPVTRKLLGCKRRSDKRTDEIEDGGRASVIEESISALLFQYAEKHNMLDGVGRIDSDLLNLVTRLTSGLEVREASAGDWEMAILLGYKVFRLLDRHRGGIVTVDLVAHELKYQKAQATKK
ncbi:MAG: nucleoside triphosphate pyrophosphohydrolase family protein [Rhodocyclaceae bacterium]|nr:nucleoside triphosphate pyrophosphohydrolase family protein [Rhodocyclaceae bacterium]